MTQVLWLGVLLGAGAAFSVGPVFVTILQTAAARGFAPALRVILGSATADLLLLLPALAFAWLLGATAAAYRWIGLLGALFFLYLAGTAVRDARRLWRGRAAAPERGSWAFWKGVSSNLLNPLSWTFWLATGTPTITQARHLAGWPGLLLFTATWFGVASGLEAAIAFTAARAGRGLGPRGQSAVTVLSAVLFVALAGLLLERDVVHQAVGALRPPHQR